MGIFGMLRSAESFGIANGYLPGQLGAWGKWDAATAVPIEVLRITLTVYHPSGSALPKFSFSFLPSHDAPFYRSLAIPQAVLEVIRGREALLGHRFEFEFLRNSGGQETIVLDQQAFERAVHGKAKTGPFKRSEIHATATPDDALTASLTIEQLKSKSDEIRSALKEKARVEEEARAKAAADKEAKQKADAAKTSQPSAPAVRAASSGDPKTPTLPACKTVIFYGSSTGNTKNAAESLKECLGTVDYVKNITEVTPADFAVPENIILGIPTWHIGELQDDWAAMLPLIESVNPNVSGKKVAIFGLGDQKGYPDTYVDAIQMLWEPFEKRGAKLFGLWPTKGYEFKKSKALQGDKFMGLVIDIENQDHLTDGRIKAWAAQIKTEMGL